MGAFDWPRALATLLLLALALACWRLLQSAPAQPLAPPAAAAPKARKKPKKRAKKVAQSTSDAPLPVAPPAPPPTRAAAAAAAAAAISEGDGSDDDSDADDGLSAAQVLARRKFHTMRALGASRAATSAAPSSAKAPPKFDVGQRVLARFQGGSEWFPATVTEVRRGNEYHLRYDDGEVEFRVSHKLMKPFEVAAPPAELGTGDGDDLPAADRVSSSSDGGGDGDESAAGDGDDEEEENEDDGWEIVGAASSKAKAAKLSAGTTSSPAAGVGADGLTKRQRESRRKKERQREIKELARAQAQENGLHARWGGTYSKLKYVPPPPPHQT